MQGPAPGYPRLTALNGSALLLEVALTEPGALVFSIRPGTAAGAQMDREAVGAAAAWTPFYYFEDHAKTVAEAAAAAAAGYHTKGTKGALALQVRRRFPELGRGVAAGVLEVPAAAVPTSHVITKMPPVDYSPGANRAGKAEI